MTIDDKFIQAAEQLLDAENAVSLVRQQQVSRVRDERIAQLAEQHKAEARLAHAQNRMNEVRAEYLLGLWKQ